MKPKPLQIIATVLMTIAACCACAQEGVSDSTIRIGQTVGVTGQIAGPVKEMIEGANAYFSAVNRSGGVNGRKIEVIIRDDKFDPATAASNAEKLIKEDRVFALFQCRGTPHTQAILPLLIADKVPLVAPSTGASVFHDPVNPLLFNVRAKYQDEVTKAVQYFKTIGVKTISLVHVDDSFGADGLAGFSRAMAERGLQPASITKFNRAKPDVEAVVSEVLGINPEAVIIVSSASTTISMIQALRQKKSNMQVMTLSNNASQSFVTSLGAVGEGVIVSQITPAPNLGTSPLAMEFQAAAKASKATVSYSAMEGYVAARVLVRGLQLAGRNLTRETFVRALESIRKYEMGGLMVSYGPQRHTGSEFVELTMIGKNGRFVR